MNRENIIRMARESGFPYDKYTISGVWVQDTEITKMLERFFQAAYAAGAAAEREKCSKTKAATPRKLKRVGTGALLHMQQEHFEMGWREGAKSVRDAIRARGETK